MSERMKRLVKRYTRAIRIEHHRDTRTLRFEQTLDDILADMSEPDSHGCRIHLPEFQGMVKAETLDGEDVRVSVLRAVHVLSGKGHLGQHQEAYHMCGHKLLPNLCANPDHIERRTVVEGYIVKTRSRMLVGKPA